MCLLRAILLGLLVLANAALPGRAQSLPARIAFLDIAPPSEPSAARNWQVFSETLRALGWVDGRNIAVTRRWTDSRDERAIELAAELVAQRPDVIITAGYPNTKAVRDRTADIPIVFTNVPNPVGLGLVASLARPGGNITGTSGQAEDAIGKALQMVSDTRPGISRIAYLGYSESAYWKLTEELYTAAAQRLGLTLTMFGIKSAADVDAAFAGIVRDRPDALVVSSIAVLAAHSQKIAGFAIDNRLPTFTFSAAMARDGFLMAQSADAAGMFRSTATILDKILKGAKPGEIPVEQPTRFHFVVNLRTARALGIELTPVLLAAADEVIE